MMSPRKRKGSARSSRKGEGYHTIGGGGVQPAAVFFQPAAFFRVRKYRSSAFLGFFGIGSARVGPSWDPAGVGGFFNSNVPASGLDSGVIDGFSMGISQGDKGTRPKSLTVKQLPELSVSPFDWILNVPQAVAAKTGNGRWKSCSRGFVAQRGLGLVFGNPTLTPPWGHWWGRGGDGGLPCPAGSECPSWRRSWPSSGDRFPGTARRVRRHTRCAAEVLIAVDFEPQISRRLPLTDNRKCSVSMVLVWGCGVANAVKWNTKRRVRTRVPPGN